MPIQSPVVPRTQPTEQGLAYRTPAQFSIDVGGPLGRLGAALQARREKENQLRAARTLSDFQIEQNNVLDQLNRNAPDLSGIDSTYDEQFQARAQELLDTAPDPATRAYLYSQLTSIYQNNMLAAMTAERGRNEGAMRFEILETSDRARNIVRSHPEQFDDQLQVLSDQLGEAAGVLNQQELEELARQKMQELLYSALQGNVERDPEAAIEELHAGVLRSPGVNALIYQESGGDPRAMNDDGYAGLYQFGAPRLSDLGIYTPGPQDNITGWDGNWTGEFNIPGYPQVETIEDFLASPGAQHAAWQIHRQRMDNEIIDNGFDNYIGQYVNGVRITRQGLYNMIHLAGVEGTRTTLSGRGNPVDANGMSALEYAEMGSTGIVDALLRPEQKESLLNYAYAEFGAQIQRRQALEVDIASEVEARQEANYAELMVALAREEASMPDFIDALDNDRVSTQQFRNLREDYRKMQDEGGTGDAQLALETRIGVLSGEVGIEDVMALDGLDNAQRLDLVNLVDTVTRRGGDLARADVQFEQQRIRQMVAGVTSFYGQTDITAAARLANALTEFNDRIVAEGPENAREIADDVIRRYPPLFENLNDQLTSMARPRFWSGPTFGTREELLTRQGAAYQQLEQFVADNPDAMTSAEYERELSTLTNYKRAIESMDDAGTGFTATSDSDN